MKSRLIIYGSLLIVAVYVLTNFTGDPDPQGLVESFGRGAAVSLVDVEDQMSRAYRLQPDRRVTQAVAEAHHLITGEPRAACAARFERGQWVFTYAGQDVGSLPDLFDFASGYQLLREWSETLTRDRAFELNRGTMNAEQRAEVMALVDAFWPNEQLLALRAIDELWQGGLRDPELIVFAAQALVHLAVQHWDTMEVADQLPARALATIALAEVTTNWSLSAERALLAGAMDYTLAAEEAASALDADDPVRLYTEHRTEALATVGATAEGTRARYLAYRRIVEQGDSEADRVFRTTHLRAPPTTTAYFVPRVDLRSLRYHGQVSLGVQASLTLLLGQQRNEAQVQTLLSRVAEIGQEVGPADLLLATGGAGDSRSTLLARLATQIDEAPASVTGPFLDALTVHSVYSGPFYSSLHIEGTHYLDSLASIPAVERYTQMLDRVDSQAARDVVQWLAHAMVGGPALQTLSGCPNLGGAAMRRVFKTMSSQEADNMVYLMDATRALVARLDTRLNHRDWLGQIAFDQLNDLDMAETLHGSAREQRARPGAYGRWFATFMDEFDGLRALLDEPATTPAERAEIIEVLYENDQLPLETALSMLEALAEANRGSWDVHEAYAKLLRHAERLADVRTVIQTWIDINEPQGLQNVAAQRTIAEAFRLEQRYAEGWSVIQPYVQSMQRAAMREAALLLDALGRQIEADRIAQAALERYSRPQTVDLLAGLRWCRGDLDAATATLRSYSAGLSSARWFELGGTFARCLADDPETAVSAFGRLQSTNVVEPIALLGFALGVAQHDHPQLAFDLVARIRAPGMMQVYVDVTGYELLKQAQGQQAALDWLSNRVAGVDPGYVAMVSFGEGIEELLWDLVPAADDYLWMTRAAAWRQSGSRDNEWKRALHAHFADATDGHYNLIGRFLLGLEEQSTVIAESRTQRGVCELAFFLGIDAETRGDYRQASHWYRTAVETRSTLDGEWRWAQRILARWSAFNMSLDELAEHADEFTEVYRGAGP